mmetsp:Transcript_17404/g.20070  ORF Transcript_17404/g.20070 Transcript_17404/m.20070 type:complete len:370 (-) Transcript_17404:1021-2130(-)
MGLLEGEGLVRKWEGRFGLLGSRGGGFLPSSVVGGLSPNAMGSNSEASAPPAVQPLEGGDSGDFCGFVSNHESPTFVGYPNNAALCPRICELASIETVSDARFLQAEMVAGGGWRLDVDVDDGGNSTNSNLLQNVVFDALILTTHDPVLAANTIECIARNEAEADTGDNSSSNSDIEERLHQLAHGLRSLQQTPRHAVFTWSGRFPSLNMPFDAASVPGSHLVQFLARESSKPGYVRDNSSDGNDNTDVWSAISTTALATDLLQRHGSNTQRTCDEAFNLISREVVPLLTAASTTTNAIPSPEEASAVCWRSAFPSRTLGLKEDSIILHPWRLAIGGDFIRALDTHSSPFEAAAMSGLEAGERIAALFE